ncbi:MAG: DUF1156 domain-containing protein, partial [Acidothermus sp.]|nr:DUF1156 domain-containing protein [Acidothermus sp.]
MAADHGFRRKLIEVMLPLEAIDREASREKSLRHGHPSTLHLWWSRKPLAACRAVLFAQLLDDPSAHPEKFPDPESQDAERKRLLTLIERMVPWEANRDTRLWEEVRDELRTQLGEQLPLIADPFCGGGSIPLEAVRLGLAPLAGDLNPVAALITKGLVGVPAPFVDRPPVHPGEGSLPAAEGWRGLKGLAEDIRHYGAWVASEARARIGHLYPDVRAADGEHLTVIAWLWVRTVTCPNPACRAIAPLTSSFWLSKKKGGEAWVKPVVDGRRVRFEISHDPAGPPLDGTVNRRGATCVRCSTPIPFAHVRAEGTAGRLGAQLLAIVAEGNRRRVYLPPDPGHEKLALQVSRPEDLPNGPLSSNPRNFNTPLYGLTTYLDLFTNRQLVALSTFSDVVREVRGKVVADGGKPEYADAVTTYLGFAVSRLADYSSALCSWNISRIMLRNTFARQALPMVWDFAEGNPFSDSSGNWLGAVEWVAEAVEELPGKPGGTVVCGDAAEFCAPAPVVVCTDPPYFDNIGYANLADYFYLWLRRTLADVHPNLFATMLTPKAAELVADPYRLGGDKAAARKFFEENFERAFRHLAQLADPRFPLVVFYAFKQSEQAADGVTSTGWETMLGALLRAGLMITATWPLRTERANRPNAQESNALASSVALVCRPRPPVAEVTDRRGFLTALHAELPRRVRELQAASLPPADLPQSAIGPGIAVFSRYAKVLESDGSA